jgi:single-stranded-DNA-specific exonuclease
VRFGGHHAAAGLTVRAERVESLRASFDDAVRALVSAHGRVRTVEPIDVVLDGAAFPVPSARELAQLEPLGAGNAEPRFALPGVRVERASVVGERHLKLALRFGRTPISGFGFDLGARLSEAHGTLDLVGALRPDTWRGGDAVELRIASF